MPEPDWIRIPGADEHTASFGYGDGLLEAHTHRDGTIDFGGAFFHPKNGLQAAFGPIENIEAVLAKLTHVVCEYWRGIPENEWCGQLARSLGHDRRNKNRRRGRRASDRQ